MANVLAFPTALLDLTRHTTDTANAVLSPRAEYHTELSIAATRFELAVSVGAVIGGVVGVGLGAITGCVAGAVPGGAIGAVVGGAALGIPVGVCSWFQMNNALTVNIVC
jgi:F0F1-type ATP synthase assembly protein I